LIALSVEVFKMLALDLIKLLNTDGDGLHGDLAYDDGYCLLVYRLAYNDDIVAFKMGRRRGARRAHI
jgi:hypothetical protein